MASVQLKQAKFKSHALVNGSFYYLSWNKTEKVWNKFKLHLSAAQNYNKQTKINAVLITNANPI